jgi:hypothetical protein
MKSENSKVTVFNSQLTFDQNNPHPKVKPTLTNAPKSHGLHQNFKMST